MDGLDPEEPPSAWPADVAAAITHLLAEAAELEGEERVVKVHASQLLDDGLRRFGGFSSGIMFRPWAPQFGAYDSGAALQQALRRS